jgi:hypothetical protein
MPDTRRYNEEADELAKIASRRITVPPNVLRRTSPSRPSTSSRHPRAKRNPRGLPRTQRAWSPWTRTPRTRRLYSPCSRDMARTRPRPWTRSQPPAWRTGETSTSPGWMEGNFSRTDPRLDASPGWPSHSPLSTASCKSAPLQASCSNACPSPRCTSSYETFTRACAATTRRRAPSWATHSARASIGPLRLLMPARSCAPAKGANFTPAKLTSQLTPSRRSPSQGLLLCGGWTLSGPCERCPGATPTY